MGHTQEPGHTMSFEDSRVSYIKWCGLDPAQGLRSTCLNAVVLPRYEKAERFPGVLFDDSSALPFQLHSQLACSQRMVRIVDPYVHES